ncbi:amino acid permease [Streptomyces purpurogeneiscleroticus]|uniref:amino acid permease n=1 Tax=Streptomyces purpurogeneiscleroticus TaxID=68259 RepID=UPI001CBD7FC8|nr:amino acid permease [Streptomyces purpurogeneiscleroticus]MBZ4019786.1 amino acid permease [Streptomyces purpurogeneiscleroticus]
MSVAREIFRRKPVDSSEEESAGGLRRTMGLWQLVALSLGGLVGAGVFSLAGVVAHEDAGPGVMLSFLIAIIASSAAALCYAEFAGTIPKAGSAYTYSYAALGEVVGWAIGWDLLLEYTAIVAVVAIAVSGYFSYVLEGIGLDLPVWMLGAPGTGAGHRVDLLAALLCLLLAFVLSRGTKESARFETILVVVKLGIVALVVIAGAFHISAGNYSPFLPYGLGGAFTGAATTFFAVYGYDAMSAAAEESAEAKKVLPKAIVISLGIAAVVYLLVCVVLLGMQDYRRIDVDSPFSSALASVGLGGLGMVVAVGAIIGITTSAFANMLAVSRVWYSMSRDGLLPRYFARNHPKRQVPTRVIWPVGIGSAVIAGFLPIREAADLTNIGILTAFIVVAVAVVVMRRTRPELPRAFRTPLVPLVPAIGVAFSVWLISNLDPVTWLRFAGWMALGMVVYALFGYRNSQENPDRAGRGQDRERVTDPF